MSVSAALRHDYPNPVLSRTLNGALGTKGAEFSASLPVAAEHSTGCSIACECPVQAISPLAVPVRDSQTSLCPDREGGMRRRNSQSLAVMGEDLPRVPPLLSRLQADWKLGFAEALSCISAANTQVHSPPDLVADLYRSQQDECAVGGGGSSDFSHILL